MKYELHTALREDIESGSMWISSPKLTSRTTVKVRNAENYRSVRCEVKMVDPFFRKEFAKRVGPFPTQDAVFVSAWYRKQLGIRRVTGIVDLEIQEAESLCSKICACMKHPQLVARIATHLAVWSVILGTAGVVFGIASCVPKKPVNHTPEPTAASGRGSS